MSSLQKGIIEAYKDEINDNHWSDADRERLVNQFEKEYEGDLPQDYPVDGRMVDKFIYIITYGF